jgi:hypothetical protein
MKRRCVILLFLIATIPAFSSAKSISSGSPELPTVDLQDCGVMTIFARVWKNTALVLEEHATWVIHSDGRYSAVDWPPTPQNRISIWNGPLPGHIVAQAHTHGDHLDPKPSGQDVNVARKMNIWVYTLTRKGIWKASPDGTVTREVSRGWYDQTLQKCGKD